MYELILHKNLDPGKWNKYSVDKQIFMVANELNRLLNGIKSRQSLELLRSCMERIFELIDLTVNSQKGSLKKELLRWREVFGAFYLFDLEDLQKAKNELEKFYKVLLLLNSKTAVLLN